MPPSYVLITPARNEEDFIEKTMQSVIAQTVRPKRWVIVSDGSTDRTNSIVEKYLQDNRWIELVKRPARQGRHFAAKVMAFNAGFEKVANEDFDIIGNLDADISFEPDYLEFLITKFAENPKLGVAGTNRWEGSLVYNYRFTSAEEVAGGCQLFRLECFQAIGGYQPVKGGGIDLLASLLARMNGWTTRSFDEKFFVHHRKSGTAGGSVFRAAFNYGMRDYMFGGQPLWQVFRSAYRMTKKPYILGGCCLLSGFVWSMLRRFERPVSQDVIRFRRNEQMARLRSFWRRLFADALDKGKENALRKAAGSKPC